MDVIIEALNHAAMVLGYPVLIFVILVVAWACAMAVQGINKIFMSMGYERKKRKDVEREIDNLNSTWLLESEEEPEYYTAEGWHDTLDLSDIPEQLYDQEAPNYEDSSWDVEDSTALRDRQLSDSADGPGGDWHPRYGISDR